MFPQLNITTAGRNVFKLIFLLSCTPLLREVDDVLRRANATEYGLASGVFTRDISKALYVSERLNAGTVFVNTYNKTDVASPFGGFKQSGFGKDLGERSGAAMLLNRTSYVFVFHILQGKRENEFSLLW